MSVSREASRLSVRLLGPFQVTLDEQPVTGFVSDKARALLAYLAVEADQPHRRERLAGLLWPEVPERAAHTSLRTALANVRRVIGDREADPPFLQVSQKTIQLNLAGDSWIDVTAFNSLPGLQTAPAGADQPAMHHVEQAVELYRGEFLEGFSFPDCQDFEEWVLLHRERLHSLVLEALHFLTECYEEQGEYRHALQNARRQLELDPWREQAHRQVMRLLALAGQRAAALAQYESCRQVLADQLGVEPDQKTTQLYELLKAGKRIIPIMGGSDGRTASDGRQQREPVLGRLTRALTGDTEAQRALQNRQAMLQLVRNIWVQGILEQSLHGLAMIELGMQEHDDAVDRPWDMVVQVPGQPRRQLPRGTKILDVFDQTNQSLLILGEPGSGKTTMLLELARDTIARAQQDPYQPIPVVFNLSSWAEKNLPIGEWLVEELNTKYHIPKKIARPWVENDDLLLLLDGLDEVKAGSRDDCVRALNTFLREHLAPVVVCSRIADYEVLATRLHLHSAVLLQPLTPGQVSEYLQDAGPELQAVRTIMKQDLTLREMVQTPLLLSVMTLAYHGLSVEDLGSLDSMKARRKHLLDTYTQRMFERRGADHPYEPEQTIHWLAWLAQKMQEHAQTVFFIEALQPDWLPRHGQRQARVVVGFTGALISALVWGSVAALTLGLVAWPLLGSATGLDTANRILLAVGPKLMVNPKGFEILLTVSVNLLLWIAGIGLVGGLAAGLALGLLVDLRTVQPVEALRWSWRRAASGLVRALAGVAVSGRGSVASGPLRWSCRRALSGILAVLVVIPVVRLVFGSLFWAGILGLAAGLAWGLIFGLYPVESDKMPKWRWGKALVGLVPGLVWGPFVGLVSGLLVGVMSGLVFEWADSEVCGILVGLIACLTITLLLGLAAGRGIIEIGGITARSRGTPQAARRITIAVLPLGLICGWLFWVGMRDPFFGLLLASLLGFAVGLEGVELEVKAVPNQGIQRSFRHAIAVLVVCLLCSTLTSMLVYRSWGNDGLVFLNIVGLLWGLVMGIRYGGKAVILHFALRYILWRRGCIPRRYVHFLDYASARIFLRKVGGGYIFVHRLLLDYFASLYQARS